MKKTRLIHLSLIWILLISFTACTTGTKQFVPGKSKALFDYFSYIGDDDIYKENPLTSDDQFYNPILPGWYSDPSICTNGEDYFLVTSTFAYFPGVPLFHSRDLVNWKQIGHVLDRTSQLINLDDRHIGRGIFAPAISYNKHNQTYYMITTNVSAGNFFVKTKDPFSSWSEPIPLPEVGGIDPSFFFDDDGRAYIVNNDGMDGKELYEGHRSIRIHEFDVENDQTTGKAKMIVNGGVNLAEKPIWIEGPHLYKINGKYYLMAAEGGTSIQHSEVIFTSDSPMGVYKPWDKNPILTQRHLSPDRPYPVTCTGHADLIQTKEGDWWAIFLACRPIDNEFENLGRETFIMPVKWSEDGFPYMAQGDETVPFVLQREGVVRDKDVTFGNFEWRDEFNDKSLGLEWMTLRAPAADLYSLTENKGYLTLNCSEVRASEMKTPAFVTRRIQHHKFVCETGMYFNPSDENETAGLMIFKNETNNLFLYVQQKDGKKQVGLAQAKGKIVEGKPDFQTNELQTAPLSVKDGQKIRLKIISAGKTFDFYYAVEDGDWQLLTKNIDASSLSTAVAGGFTGTTIGMYAVRNK